MFLSRPFAQPLTLFHSQFAVLLIPFHRPLSKLAPASAILLVRPTIASTMPVTIFGTAFTISTMIVGRFSIRATKRSTPA